MGYQEYSDSYLRTFTKEQLIRQLRVAEHNFRATEQTLNQLIENVKNYEPKKMGVWVPDDNYLVCSQCGYEYAKYDYQDYMQSTNCCPECGSKNVPSGKS